MNNFEQYFKKAKEAGLGVTLHIAEVCFPSGVDLLVIWLTFQRLPKTRSRIL